LANQLTDMRFLYSFIFSCCFISFAFSAFANNKNPKIETEPKWITATQINYTNTSLDAEALDGYSDLHYEKQVSLEHNAVYCKSAMHILSEAGVQNQSQVSVEYDPSYQTVSFHSIKIIRGTQTINQLNLSKIKTVQQEKELDRFLYNGTLTAVLFLEDVRKDDIIEYSYTISGFNPVFKNKFTGTFMTQFGVPIYELFYKLVVPNNRNITIKNSLTTIQPSVSKLSSATSYEWKASAIAPLNSEDNLPSWYDIYPAVLVSEYQSWKEVADWASELFPFSATLPANIKNKVDEIKAKNKTPEDQLLAALHFVQDDIRYLGIEMGTNSHKPYAPSQVLKQRFGDCKDKAYLLCTLLRAMDIEAYPVLNNTTYKKTISTWLPSPGIFDHCTVCVKINNKTYWFDGTISSQRGLLSSISYPNYQIGLVVQPGTTSLTNIAVQDDARVETKESFYVEGFGGPVKLVVLTNFYGSFADNVRNSFKNSSVKERLADYKKLYTPYFEKLQADSLRYEDNEQTGVFTTTEYYTISDFWKRENSVQKVSLEPFLINNIYKKPASGKREMPYAITFPGTYTEQIDIHLPEDWPITSSDFAYKTPSFLLDFSYSRPANDLVRLEYRYKALADHIAPENMNGYLNEINEAEKHIAFQLSNDFDRNTTYSVNMNFPATNMYNVAYTILGICVFATYLHKRKKKKLY